MVELVIIGFVAGIVCGISPCILPVLPVILVAGASTPQAAPPVKAVAPVKEGAPAELGAPAKIGVPARSAA